MKVMLLGSGSSRERRLSVEDGVLKFHGGKPFDGDLTSVDYVGSHNPTFVWDLNAYPWGFGSRRTESCYDEVHAYEVLEHLGRLGDFVQFFACFREIWRMLKPGGHLLATVPHWASMWALGDPSHTRVISRGSLVFLDQMEYVRQIGHTPMSDFRDVWKEDFELVSDQILRDEKMKPAIYAFALKAIKPSRIQR